jgi:NAD(P)-dependent dehydrogenase (short-subunit alcohol dehydrogenase family)
MKDLKNSVVLVTGANRGLGRNLVNEALTRGAVKVYAATRKPYDFGDSRVVNIILDVTDAAAIAKLPELAPDMNVLVNNAGAFFPDSILTANMDNVRMQFETNVFGPIQITQVMAPVLKANGGGILLEILSVASWLPLGSYSTTKAALWMMTNSLRQELAEQGTLVVGAHMGPMDTDMIRGIIEGPKNDPIDVARIIFDGVEKGDIEILVDDLTKHIKSVLAGSPDLLKLPA